MKLKFPLINARVVAILRQKGAAHPLLVYVDVGVRPGGEVHAEDTANGKQMALHGYWLDGLPDTTRGGGFHSLGQK